MKPGDRPGKRTAEKRGSLAKKNANQQDDGGASSADHDRLNPLDTQDGLLPTLRTHRLMGVEFSFDRCDGGLAHQSASAIVKSPAAT